MWRGSLLPLGSEAAPNGTAAQFNGSKLPRHRTALNQSSKSSQPPICFQRLTMPQNSSAVFSVS
ncbi:hypothetical protein EIY72_02345 [Pseudomonas vancouverensis]|uniref:Uncharacterized protein n=1 Tax=Pseudomonas vancouverensis TaxID=95300 RepID=A0A4R4KPB8_PSEVA|nr:hypothetical protein F7R09_03375 [Pseudomonas vancouverensis]TDB68722.1 hypothetical protein EIY72_02345 [Pseudomonas vancouverensis]